MFCNPLTMLGLTRRNAMQQVRLGKTKTGRFGYFTNGILAWGLTPEQYGEANEWHEKFAKSLGFTFILGGV